VRARNIKPGFYENEDLVELSFACRHFFVGLWCLADREGRLEDRPKKIKLALAPLDDVNPDKILDELNDRNLIVRYSVNSSEFISIPNFLKHQRPHHNEKKSEIPPPPEKQEPDIPSDEKLDLAKALLDERITEDEAGMTIEEAFLTLGESPSDHGRKHFALNPDSLNDDSLNKSTVEFNNSTPPFSDIISHLNGISNHRFSPKNKATRRLIQARWNEGRRLEDFKRVHKTKWEEWKGKPEMLPYYRPETLYTANHFESYLNQQSPEDERNARRERLRRKHGKDR